MENHIHLKNESLAQQSVAEIVMANPVAIEVFEQFGIDYCCGGKRQLQEVCDRRHLSVEAVEEALVAATIAAAAQQFAERPEDLPLPQLVDHIVARHHAFVRTETAEIQRLAGKVAHRHGDAHPELHEIKALFQSVAEELAAHMQKEELILFPWIKRLVAMREGTILLQQPPFGSVGNPIHMMEAEHEQAGADLARMRELTQGYTLPEGACMSYWQLYQLLDAFEKDLHVHVHLENNVLFPQAMNLEAQLHNYAKS